MQLFEFLNRPALQCATGTGCHAGGLKSDTQAIDAHVALGHVRMLGRTHLCFFQRLEVLRRTPGAGLRTSSATDALGAVDNDRTEFLFLGNRLDGTNLYAGRIIAMVA